MNDLDARAAAYWETAAVRSIMTQVASAARQLAEVMTGAPEDADNAEWGGQLTFALLREFGELDTAGGEYPAHSNARDAIAKLAEVIEDSRDGNTFGGG